MLLEEIRKGGKGTRCVKYISLLPFKQFYLFPKFLILQKKRFLDVINVEYGHRCRAEPIEAAIYSLAAKCVGFDKFRATATAQLTVDIDETSAKQEEKKTEQFSLELPVDFSKEKVAKVRLRFANKLKESEIELVN